jgi:hypothetical protein
VLAARGWALALLGKESAVALPPALLGVWIARPPTRRWISDARVVVGARRRLVIWGGWRVMIRLKGVDDADRAEPQRRRTLLATARFEVKAVTGAISDHVSRTSARARRRRGGLAALVGWAALIVFMARRRDTRLAAAGAFALLTALPTSPLVGPANDADRHLFLPALGGAMVWAHGRTARAPDPRRLHRHRWPSPRFPRPASGRAAAPWVNDLTL